ncbi:MAG: thiol:disulfide interchange protein DsbA/DsbL [Lautropia sp.]
MKPSSRRQRRRIVSFVGVLPVIATAACAVTQAQPPEEGFEYRAVPAPLQRSPDAGHEVVEFFWYGCPHCRAFEPTINAWRRRLASDVAFRKVHVALAPRWVAHQQLYFTLLALDRADDATNARVFDAIQVDGNPLDSRERVADFAAVLGIDRTRFLTTHDSPAVRAAMDAANELAVAMGVGGVPAISVDGRWSTSPSMAGDQASTLRVVDHLLRTGA